MKILVVDDQTVNRKLPIAVLTSVGCSCLEAASGEDALQLVAADPDISHLLLDISMPGMSGIEVCAALRSLPDRPLHIIAYTAHAFEGEKSEIMAAGFDALLLKPIKRENLLHVLGLP